MMWIMTTMDIDCLDCEKPFDRGLLQKERTKLVAMGLGGRILRWINNFLAGRSHRSSVYDWIPVISAIPQGSALFVIYINDLVINLESGTSLFEDDAKIYKTIRTGGYQNLSKIYEKTGRVK